MKDRRRLSQNARRQVRQPVPSHSQVVTKALSRRRGRLLVLAGALAVTVAVPGYYLLRLPAPSLPAVSEEAFSLPPLSSIPFLNTRADARYVGSDTCRECHAGETASFRRTGMGRSM